VGDAAGVGWVDAAEAGPAGPTAFNGAQRRDEDAIHIEEDALAADLYRRRSEGCRHVFIVAGTKCVLRAFLQLLCGVSGDAQGGFFLKNKAT
jgi:hypothetical protein